MSKKVFWISSYPKSGNTWLRSILSSLFFTSDGKFNFSLLKNIKNFDTVEIYNFVQKINKEDYDNLNSLQIISKYWTRAQENLEINGDFIFLKTHSGCFNYFNNAFTNVNNTLGYIYIVRDPRDIVISYSRHLAKDVNRIIKIMTYKMAVTLAYDNERNFSYPVLMSTWGDHVNSWQGLKVPRLIIKYEDILKDTDKIIYEIINFFIKNYGLKFNNIDKKVKNILQTTNFLNLKKLENKYGFEEKYIESKHNFFREGKTDQWRKLLNKVQIINCKKYNIFKMLYI